MFNSASRLVLLGLFLTTICRLTAQNKAANRADVLDKFNRYQHYTIEQGLSNNSVSSMVQDADGFMWFGTSEGLNRFDGHQFKSFFRRDDGRGLTFDDIGKLLLLSRNRLLIATWKGLCVMNTRNLTITRVSLPIRPEYAEGDQIVWDIILDKNGQIWAGTGTAIHVLDDNLTVKHSYFTPQQAGQSSNNHFAREFLELPDGTVTVKCQLATGVQDWQVVDFQSNTLKYLAQTVPWCGLLDSAKGLGNVWVEQKTQQIWYTATGSQSRNTLNYLDWTTKTHHALLKNEQPLKSLDLGQLNRPYRLPDNQILVQRFAGKLMIYNVLTGDTLNLDKWNSSIQSQKDMTYFVDKDDNLWLCPQGEGIYFLPLKDPSVKSLNGLNTWHENAMKQQIVPSEWFRFYGLDLKNVQIFSSPSGGLYKINKGNGAITSVSDAQNKAFSSAFRAIPYNLDTVWLDTRGGLYWYKTSNNTHGLLKNIAPELGNLSNEFLYRDSYGLIWGAVKGNGVAYFDTKTHQFKHFPSQGQSPPFPTMESTGAIEDKDGNVWFCSRLGADFFVKWTRQTGQFEKVTPLSKNGKNCASARIFLTDRRGNLWVKTTEEGVFCINTQTLDVQSFRKADGLSTNQPNAICIDKFDNVWFATPLGLSRYDPIHKFMHTFYQSDGLLANGIKNVELFDTLNNTLLVTTDKGLCLFDPNKIPATVSNPTTYITSVSISKDSFFAAPESGILELPYYKNNISLAFTSINFYDGGRNRYQYRLEGMDLDWRNSEVTNATTYLNLPPNTYTFRVRVANTEGVWSEQEAKLIIKIYPPFWATWTFRLLVLALLAGIAWWLYQRQIRGIQAREIEKNKVRQQLADLEMKALRSQMNPHFVFNALNSVQNFILKNDTREASRYLTKFARLMRLILENSESPVVPLGKEIELLKHYIELESLRFSTRFSYHFDIDNQLSLEAMSIPGMLIQPHIENAIWHGLMHKAEGGEGQLSIRFIKANEHTIICEIEDNGVGRVAAAAIEKDRQRTHRSTGIDNIKHRLALLNAQLADDIRLNFNDLYAEDGQATGTKVVVRMPIILR
jgi:ligand-binding sensor domain-containing protein